MTFDTKNEYKVETRNKLKFCEQETNKYGMSTNSKAVWNRACSLTFEINLVKEIGQH